VSPVFVHSVQIRRGLKGHSSRDSGGLRGPGKGKLPFPGDHSRASVIYCLTSAASLTFFNASPSVTQPNSCSRRHAGRTSVHCRHVHAQRDACNRGAVINSCVTDRRKQRPRTLGCPEGQALRCILDDRRGACPPNFCRSRRASLLLEHSRTLLLSALDSPAFLTYLFLWLACGKVCGDL